MVQHCTPTSTSYVPILYGIDYTCFSFANNLPENGLYGPKRVKGGSKIEKKDS
jgi:hypothetical protein